MVRDRRAQVDNGQTARHAFPGPPIDCGDTRNALNDAQCRTGRRRAPRQTRADPARSLVAIRRRRQPARSARPDESGRSSRCRNRHAPKPILYRANDVEVQVFACRAWHGDDLDADVADLGREPDVRAENLGLATSRFFRFTPYPLYAWCRPPRPAIRQYLLLRPALARLQSTVIATTIRQR